MKVWFALAGLLISFLAKGQVLDVTEGTDYVRPSISRTTSSLYSFINVKGGVIKDYQFDNRFLQDDYWFTRVGWASYYGNLQFNVKGLYASPFNDNDADVRRGKVQLAYYIPLGSSQSKFTENDSIYEIPPVAPLRIQLTYQYINVDEEGIRYDDHQIGLDWTLPSFSNKSSSPIALLYANYFVSWMVNRKNFLYGLSANSYTRVNDRANVVKSIIYGYSLCRNKVEGIDRWGNAKINLGVAWGPQYSRLSFTTVFSWSRDLHRKITNYELTGVIALPVTLARM
jgi:hypothetical protein